MIFSYLKTAFRNILRFKGFSFINIFGLALSMSVCLLIILVISDQLSYDDFHKNRDRIYRVLTNDELSDDLVTQYASTALPIGQKIEEDYDLVEAAAVFNNRLGGDWEANNKVIPVQGFYANNAFFKVFDFEVKGDSRDKLLLDPQTVVIREELARKFFGEQDPLGQTIQIDTLGNFTITGIIPESKNKTHLKFDALVSIEAVPNSWNDNWTNVYSSYAYLLFKENMTPEQFEHAFTEIRETHYINDPDHDYSFSLQALPDICPGKILGNEPGFFLPNIFVYFMAALAFIVILSAAFNYTNLSLAKSLNRTAEIGVRKVVGANKAQIMTQFLVESIVIAVISLIIAYAFLQFLKPAFSKLQFMSLLEISPGENVKVYVYFLLFAILTGFLAGILPASYLSSFNPVNIFKAGGKVKIFSRTGLRKILLVAQFSISIILIVTIILLVRQLDFYMNKDYGFNKDNVFNLVKQGLEKEIVVSELEKIPEVQQIAWGSHIPAIGSRWDMEFWKDNRENRKDISYFSVDHNYLDVMKLNLVAGRNFPENKSGDLSDYIIINEKTVEVFQLGTPAEALGTVFYADDSVVVEVIGVISDYHYMALFERIGPMGLLNNVKTHRIAHMIINTSDVKGFMNKIENLWKKLDPVHEIQAEYLDEEIRDFYKFFTDILYMAGFASLLAVIIACLGLLGMAVYTIEIRLKEFGIRKVMGADGGGLFLNAGKSFFIMIIIASAIAIPIAYFGNNLWLDSLPYTVNFGILDVLAGVLITLIIAFLTIFPQTIRASHVQPASLLKYE